MIKTRIMKVKSIENEDIITTIKMIKIIISVIMIITILVMTIIKVKIGNRI